MIDVRVPALGESITEAVIARWHKNENDWIEQDELLLELETDKVTLEVTAPAAGIIKTLKAKVNDSVKIGDVIAQIDETQNKPKVLSLNTQSSLDNKVKDDDSSLNRPIPQKLSPSVQRLINEHHLDPAQIQPTGPKRNITKGDVLSYIERTQVPSQNAQPTITPITENQAQQPRQAASLNPSEDQRPVTRKPLSRLRQTIAERLKNAQNTAAILTTFNEVDMTNILKLRAEYQEEFQRLHGLKLGFMPFFVRACVSALQKYPDVNARIVSQEVVYPEYCDIGVAVGTAHGLVVPILRNAQDIPFVDIEKQIADFALRAKENKLKPDEMTGGTFTISNGGVYGSLLSTPILNPPQSAILGMHKIQKRPVAMEDDTIQIRQMMYLALSYDHRLIDGKGAVSFLVHVKNMLENPERLLLGL